MTESGAVAAVGALAQVPVDGGALAVRRLGPAQPLALAIHGITANSQSWAPVAERLGDRLGLAAVDLRGRGDSAGLPQPFGIDAHVRDLLAVLDAYGLERALVVGHSLGAYIAAELAAAHPERVAGLVLVDGGLPIPGADQGDPEVFLRAFLSRTLARLETTFADRDAYRRWWAEHPAIAGQDVAESDLRRYADYDLGGEPGAMRSRVNPDVVAPDGTDLVGRRGADGIAGEAVHLCAERGMTDDPNPMQPLDTVSRWARADPEHRRAVPVPGVNHYTITLGAAGADAVARELLRAAG